MLLDPSHLLICSECVRICKKNSDHPGWSLPPLPISTRRTKQKNNTVGREVLFPTKLSTKALLARLLQEWPTFLAPQSLVVPSVTCLSKQETWSKGWCRTSLGCQVWGSDLDANVIILLSYLLRSSHLLPEPVLPWNGHFLSFYWFQPRCLINFLALCYSY